MHRGVKNLNSELFNSVLYNNDGHAAKGIYSGDMANFVDMVQAFQ